MRKKPALRLRGGDFFRSGEMWESPSPPGRGEGVRGWVRMKSLAAGVGRHVRLTRLIIFQGQRCAPLKGHFHQLHMRFVGHVHAVVERAPVKRSRYAARASFSVMLITSPSLMLVRNPVDLKKFVLRSFHPGRVTAHTVGSYPGAAGIGVGSWRGLDVHHFPLLDKSCLLNALRLFLKDQSNFGQAFQLSERARGLNDVFSRQTRP